MLIHYRTRSRTSLNLAGSGGGMSGMSSGRIDKTGEPSEKLSHKETVQIWRRILMEAVVVYEDRVILLVCDHRWDLRIPPSLSVNVATSLKSENPFWAACLMRGFWVLYLRARTSKLLCTSELKRPMSHFWYCATFWAVYLNYEVLEFRF